MSARKGATKLCFDALAIARSAMIRPGFPLIFLARLSWAWVIGPLVLGLAGCAAPRYTVDDGRAVDPVLLQRLQSHGLGERQLRPAIARSADLKDIDCDRQWELPFSVASSQGWSESERVAWVRALGVDERPTVIAVTHEAPLKLGDRLVEVDGDIPSDARDLLTRMGRLRDRGRPFQVGLADGRRVLIAPFEVCRGYTRLAPPNTPELQEYHWLLTTHPLELVEADLTSDEALWVVLWTQGVSEQGGARMKTYHYGTSLLSGLYTVATLTTGLKGAAMAAEAALKTAQQAAAAAATEVLKQQLIDQAKRFAADQMRDQVTKTVRTLTQAQVAASMQQAAANKGMLWGISRVAATVFDQADLWAYERMTRLGADPLAGFGLHQKLLERGLLMNALVLDPERMENLQARVKADGREDAMVAKLRGLRPDTLVWDDGDMPLASVASSFSYEDDEALRRAGPQGLGWVEALIGAPEPLPAGR